MDVLSEIPRLTFYRGRVALSAILKALGVGPGDEVATQAFTCVAVPEGISACGATPLYIDTEPDGVNMDPVSLGERLTPATKAIVVQHTFGIPAELTPIMRLAEERGVPVVEDCCHTYASTYGGRTVGSFGRAAFYSFEWGKPIVCGIGGSAVTDDPGLHEGIERQWLAMTERRGAGLAKLQVQYAGWNALYRPSRYWQVKRLFHRLSAAGAAEGNYNATGETAADFGWRMAGPIRRRLVQKLRQAGAVAEHARWVAGHYQGQVHSEAVAPVNVPDGADPVYARFPLFVDNKAALLERAEEAGIEVADWYTTPIHPLERADWGAVGYRAGLCPNAERACERIVSLPTGPRVTAADIDRTVTLLNGF